MGNYDGISGVGRTIFEHDHDTQNEPLIDEEGIRLNECYHDKHTGNLILTYSSHKRQETVQQLLENGGKITIKRSVRIDDPDSHWLEVPIKAHKEWDEFVDSLPKWNQ